MPKGLYLWGPVGCGKTMIANVAFSALSEHAAALSAQPDGDATRAFAVPDEALAPAASGATAPGLPAAAVTVPASGEESTVSPLLPLLPLRRMHFHSLLMEIHGRLARARAAQPADDPDSPSDRELLRSIATDIAGREALVLLVDDLEMVDVADAFLMELFFTTLSRSGSVLLVTSNWAPQELYRDGLQREYFQPFIRMLEVRGRRQRWQGGMRAMLCRLGHMGLAGGGQAVSFWGRLQSVRGPLSRRIMAGSRYGASA
jgi:predicted ATPase